MSHLGFMLVAAALSLSTSSNAESDNVTRPDSSKESLIASALSAGPPSVTDDARIIDHDGKVLRQGSNGFTCMPESPAMGPMCNDDVWMAMIGALMGGAPYEGGKFGMSYMLAGEGASPGVSNIEPAATKPTPDNQWIKDGPHLMVILPDPAVYADMSSDPADPVYVMWKNTPYAHLMVRIAEKD